LRAPHRQRGTPRPPQAHRTSGSRIFSSRPLLCAPQTALPERSFAGSVPFIPAVGRLDFLSSSPFQPWDGWISYPLLSSRGTVGFPILFFPSFQPWDGWISYPPLRRFVLTDAYPCVPSPARGEGKCGSSASCTFSERPDQDVGSHLHLIRVPPLPQGERDSAFCVPLDLPAGSCTQAVCSHRRLIRASPLPSRERDRERGIPTTRERCEHLNLKTQHPLPL
jgi:hypothetical protein